MILTSLVHHPPLQMFNLILEAGDDVLISICQHHYITTKGIVNSTSHYHYYITTQGRLVLFTIPCGDVVMTMTGAIYNTLCGDVVMIMTGTIYNTVW